MKTQIAIFINLITIFILSTFSSGSPSSDPIWENITPTEKLDGWKIVCGPATYSVEAEVVTGTSVAGSPNTFLITEKSYGDFELEYEFKVDGKLNSGVQIRSEVNNGVLKGCQIEIDMDKNRQRFWSAGIFEEGDRGWLCDLKENPQARAAHKLEEWNHVRVVARGALIQTWLNGVPAAGTYCGQRLKGVIGLQVHGVGSGQVEPLQVQWRDMKLRDLGKHQWLTIIEKNHRDDENPDAENSGVEITDTTPENLLTNLKLPAGVESLRVTLDLQGPEKWRYEQGDFSFSMISPRKYQYTFPPVTAQGDPPTMGPFGAGSSPQEGEIQIYLHNGPWGSGFEIIGSRSLPATRQMSIAAVLHPSPGQDMTISPPESSYWRLEALVPQIAEKAAQEVDEGPESRSDSSETIAPPERDR